jgi:hypothetical protein
MDDPRGGLRLRPVRTKPVGRTVPTVTVVVALLVGVALLKPWGPLFPAAHVPAGSSGVETGASAPVTPSPSPPPTECAFAGGWRVFALGRPDRPAGATDEPLRPADIGNPVRRWLEVEPLTVARGPDDSRIPFVTIVSDRIGGIGYCPPPDGTDGPPPDARFEAWSLDATGIATALPLRAVTVAPASIIEVGIFVRADEPDGDRARWDPGRYVFAIASTEGEGYARWFGVEIRTPPGRTPD